ncbi:subtilisin family serine protease [Rheinheimera pacifica]|uniref:S8 family peptidase n=1 Tax=Rheinheimera pacifica TaxID=173990 RepID=UPI0021683063|nr:S8 family serine peptidase [Rheinheimera pacifica]MCS4309270.1 subtilisin family serine protease [Rheinheimera pacifica]
MKKINTTLFAIACSAAVMSVPVAAAEALQRLVVSFKTDSAERVSAQSTSQTDSHCFTLNSGTNWCVPVPVQNRVYSAQASSVKAAELKSQVVSVPAELPLEQAIQILSETGWYQLVEKDIAVSVGTWNLEAPNDQYFAEQFYFSDNSADNPNGSSILSQWTLLKNPEKLIHVYVLDTGFRVANDLDYQPGFNFETVDENSRPGPGFLEDDFIVEGGSCSNMHGVGVAGVVGAKINNDTAVAGTTGDVAIHPLRVMRCGSGFMSDVATALNWLSGDSINGFPDFDGVPGVVNMSLGGKNADALCPSYIQTAINRATAAGFVLVTSAGNEGDSADFYIPGNCENVINVGATNTGLSGHPADIASFSNYGPKLDVMAVGEEVVGLVIDNKVGYWSGTSSASPLVAGMIANAKKDFDFTPAQWASLMPISSVSRWVDGARCNEVGCANGVLDAVKLYENAQKLQDGTLDSLTLSLNAVSACRQKWMLENLSKGQKLCDQAVIKMGSMAALNEGEYIEVHALRSGQTVEDGTGLSGSYTQSTIVMDKSEFVDRTVFVRRCDAQGQCQYPIPLSTLALNETPEACLE